MQTTTSRHKCTHSFWEHLPSVAYVTNTQTRIRCFWWHKPLTTCGCGASHRRDPVMITALINGTSGRYARYSENTHLTVPFGKQAPDMCHMWESLCLWSGYILQSRQTACGSYSRGLCAFMLTRLCFGLLLICDRIICGKWCCTALLYVASYGFARCKFRHVVSVYMP